MAQILWLKSTLVLIFLFALTACGGGGAGSGGGSGGGSGILSLNWTAPSERADGTSLALSEIGGYRVYYGIASGDYQDSILIEDGTADSSQLNAIPSGKYFVVVTAIDTDGRESTYSTEVEVTI